MCTTTDAKKRILFVDDDPAILAGLRSLLYKDRKRWEMAFADGGTHALAEMSSQPFDVVVTDMRMPGMDGATLLNKIKDAYPATGRIMLSGHAEREAIVRALPALHQLLSKPCDVRTLRSAIERGLSAGEGAATAAMIGRIDRLPSPAHLYAALANAIGSTSSLSQIAEIVKTDPALSAKFLQLVNSAYFGSGQRTSSIDHAVSLLGLERLRYITSTASVFSEVETSIPDAVLNQMRLHSTRTAGYAKSLVSDTPAETDQEMVFAAGLLHDVGRIVLLEGLGESYCSSTAAATHAEVGAQLLALWGVPMNLVEIVRHHHDPLRAPATFQIAAAAVHVGDLLAQQNEDPIAVIESRSNATTLALLPHWRKVAVLS
jgi:putative nucleotidyltransferase with HDIG domain